MVEIRLGVWQSGDEQMFDDGRHETGLGALGPGLPPPFGPGLTSLNADNERGAEVIRWTQLLEAGRSKRKSTS